jgi:hypothetical protein
VMSNEAASNKSTWNALIGAVRDRSARVSIEGEECGLVAFVTVPFGSCSRSFSG